MNIHPAALFVVVLVAASSPACGGEEAAPALQADLAMEKGRVAE